MPVSSLSRGGTNCPPRTPRTGLTLLTPGRGRAWRSCPDLRRRTRRLNAWNTNTNMSGKEGPRFRQSQWRSADLGITRREATDRSRPPSRRRRPPARARAPPPPRPPSTQLSWTRSTGEGKPSWVQDFILINNYKSIFSGSKFAAGFCLSGSWVRWWWTRGFTRNVPPRPTARPWLAGRLTRMSWAASRGKMTQKWRARSSSRWTAGRRKHQWTRRIWAEIRTNHLPHTWRHSPVSQPEDQFRDQKTCETTQWLLDCQVSIWNISFIITVTKVEIVHCIRV